VVFIGFNSAGQKGLYASVAGTLSKVIAVNDPLDGSTVADLSISPSAFDGTRTTFWAGLGNGSSGVYLAVVPVPEPTAVLGAAAAAGLLVALRRRGIRRMESIAG